MNRGLGTGEVCEASVEADAAVMNCSETGERLSSLWLWSWMWI